MCIPQNLVLLPVNVLCAIILSLLSLLLCRHAHLLIFTYIQLLTFRLMLNFQITSLLILFKYTYMRFFLNCSDNVQTILI